MIFPLNTGCQKISFFAQALSKSLDVAVHCLSPISSLNTSIIVASILPLNIPLKLTQSLTKQDTKIPFILDLGAGEIKLFHSIYVSKKLPTSPVRCDFILKGM